MKYWDSSALVTLHVEQKSTRAIRGIYESDSQVVTWILSDVEMHSALQRLGREGTLSGPALSEAISRIESMWRNLHIVSLAAPVKVRAKRLLGVHAIRAADAMQLGAALVAAEDDPIGQDFVCLDDRLSEAARREGFTVLP